MRQWSRRQFVRGVTLAGAAAALGGCRLPQFSLGTQGIPPERPAAGLPVVGMLLPNSPPAPGDPNTSRIDVVGDFLQGMQELGWVDGQNVAYIRRTPGFGPQEVQAAANELVNQHVDVIWTDGLGIRASSQATTTIPIVMLTTSDLSQVAPTSSFARSGGNVTGVASFPELQAKRLELFKEAVPSVTRIALFWTDQNTGEFTAAEAAANQLSVQLIPLQIRVPGDFASAFQAALEAQVDALMSSSGIAFGSSITAIVEFAAANRLPAMYYRTEFADAGGLMAYGIDYHAFFKHSAMYVDKILRGAHPADLPIEQPTVFDFVINVVTAQTLGISIPNDVLMQATRLAQ